MDSLSLCQGVCRRDWMSGRWRDVQVVSVVMDLRSPPRPPGSSLCCGTGSYTNESRTTAAPSLVFTTFTPRECWPGSARHTEAHCRVCVQSVGWNESGAEERLKAAGLMFFRRALVRWRQDFEVSRILLVLILRWWMHFCALHCFVVLHIVLVLYVCVSECFAFSTWITEMNRMILTLGQCYFIPLTGFMNISIENVSWFV